MPSAFVSLNGIQFHYITWKQGMDDRPVILLHGLASNARIWDLVVPHLLHGGLVPIAIDQRGHGLTDGPDGDYGFETFTGDLAAFLELFQLEKPLLVGHSWSASVVLDYAAHVRSGAYSPSGLVLVDGGLTQLTDLPGATWESVSERLEPPQLAGTPLSEFRERLEQNRGDWMLSQEAIDIILANFELRADGTISPHLTFEHHMQIVRAMWEFQTYERLSQLACPVMAVPARPKDPQGLAADFMVLKERGVEHALKVRPDLRLEWMKDSIHDIPLQHPETLANLILDFSALL